jgi:hypothetical protein
MRKLVAWAGSLTVACAIAVALAMGASAGNGGFTCTGTLASGTYNSLVVPDGATCDGTNAQITVNGGVTVGQGATFILGDEQGDGGGTINGGVSTNGAASLQIHSTRVSGGVSMNGGSGFFSAIEDNTINGGVTIDGYSGFWLGFIRNTVHGTVNISNNGMHDPDAIEIVTNQIDGNLVCHANIPNGPTVGDSGGLPNQVSGQKIDECNAPGL